jgi:hypothetical protein
MASSSSSAIPTFTPPNLAQFVHIKLDGPNYLPWLSQLVRVLKSHDLMGIVDGSEPCPPQFLVDDQGKEVSNPAHSVWMKRDQYVLSWINVHLNESVLSTVYGLHTSHQVWTALATNFASQSPSHITHLKRQLQSLNQGSKSCTEYLKEAKSLANQLAAALGQPIIDADLISFVISGLNPSLNSFITTFALASRDNPRSFSDFQTELLSHERLLNQQQAITSDATNFALFMQKQHGSFKPGFSSNRKMKNPPFNKFSPRSGPPKSFNNFGGQNSPQQQAAPKQHGFTFNNSNRVPCQICGKTNHQALDCFHRMDYSFQGRHPSSQLAAMMAQTNSEIEDQQWFADSGANAHITNELEHLSIQQPFQGKESVAVGNGAGLEITHTGSKILNSYNYQFHLKNILHCPQAATNLLSIQKFCQDNSCYFILTASHYFVKDIKTHAILLEGRSENGLYPLRLRNSSFKNNYVFTAFLGLKTTAAVWHSRLGHSSFITVERVIKAHKLPTLIDHSNKNNFCDSCQLGKSKQLPFSSSSRVSSGPLELIHTDVWTSPISSIGGCKYYIIFIDDFSRYSWFYPLHYKSEAFDNFVKFKLMAENQLNCKIRQLQSDGGGEFSSLRFQSFLTQNGIIHRKTCPHTSQQNGLAERKLRHILETGLTLLAHSGLSKKYWVDAFLTSVYIINRLPTPVLQNSSPFEKLFHKIPEYSLLRVFGCKCFPLLRPYIAHKLEYRSKACIFLGYSQKGYRCLDPLTNRVYLSRHVVFYEASYPAKEQQATLQIPSRVTAASDASYMIPVSIPPPIFETTSTVAPPFQPTIPAASETSAENPSPIHPNSASEPVADTSPLPNHPSPQSESLPPTSNTQAFPSPTAAPALPPTQPISLPSTSAPLALANPTSAHPMTTRTRTGSLRPKPFADYKLFYTTNHPPAALPSIIPEIEPSCYSKAASDARWRVAMTQEFEALIANDTWTLCLRPKQQHVIRNKWVYKIKQRPDGSIERFKARLVAKGFEQQNGVDYTDTFSPVIKSSTIRIVLALAVHFDWPIRQFDVSNAFLHGSLMEEVFMEQPQGFVDATKPDYVCKLHKSIYGLKQAPRAWFKCLSSTLLDLGFVASLVDSSLFIFIRDKIKIFLLIYVDDILVTGTHNAVINSLILQLQTQFPLKDLGPLGFFLGIEAHRSSDSLHLCQAKYITDLLHRTRMLGAKPAASPCPSGSKLSKFDGDLLPDPTEYRQVVGALLYCTLTRPEIAFSVNQLCQHMHSPSTTHWSAAKRVLRYLKHTIDHGLHFTKGTLHLQAFCDSDWAGNPDDRRSTSGFGVFLGPCLVSWSAKKQAVVSRSSTKAEYRAMSLTTAELFWLRMLFKELGIVLHTAPILWCDNVSALALASNLVYHARTKHIEVDYHFIREKVVNGDILVKFISTLDQTADIFTKGLSSARFSDLKSKLMVTALPIRLWGDVSIHMSQPNKASSSEQETNLSNEDCGPASANLSSKDCGPASADHVANLSSKDRGKSA